LSPAVEFLLLRDFFVSLALFEDLEVQINSPFKCGLRLLLHCDFVFYPTTLLVRR